MVVVVLVVLVVLVVFYINLILLLAGQASFPKAKTYLHGTKNFLARYTTRLFCYVASSLAVKLNCKLEACPPFEVWVQFLKSKAEAVSI